ncbi:Universal stress protein PHOS32 [Dichanthelium oligosanthes]|uniref:Universal stress protein PHOS32 n=1 Tax=Dichanthelium oligosanthes TaxID=888268 RepID=A0A1E5WHY1_9POAL|nr:Universal stress protein PHOS32 [Dichanthelium oligosanthes]
MATHPASPTAGAGGDRSPSAPPPVRLSAAQAVAAIHPTSPRYFFSSLAAASAAASSPHRRIGIAVDLSDESAFAVKWAVQNYLRPGDAVVLLHVRPTSVLYGADWGSIPVSVDDDPDTDIAEGTARAAAAAEGEEPEEAKKKREEDFDAFTSTKAHDLAQPLVVAQIPFKIHIVKDHDMKERLCLEAERLGLSALIMGSRGFGASRRAGKGRLGSVSDYCVHHCVCPVVVVRYPDDAAGASGGDAFGDELRTVPENEPVYHEAPEAQKGLSLCLSSSVPLFAD